MVTLPTMVPAKLIRNHGMMRPGFGDTDSETDNQVMWKKTFLIGVCEFLFF